MFDVFLHANVYLKLLLGACHPREELNLLNIYQELLSAGAQLGIFEGRGPIHEKPVSDFVKKIRPFNTVLQIHKPRK